MTDESTAEEPELSEREKQLQRAEEMVNQMFGSMF